MCQKKPDNKDNEEAREDKYKGEDNADRGVIEDKIMDGFEEVDGANGNVDGVAGEGTTEN